MHTFDANYNYNHNYNSTATTTQHMVFATSPQLYQSLHFANTKCCKMLLSVQNATEIYCHETPSLVDTPAVLW